jgi:hypothetical protein
MLQSSAIKGLLCDTGHGLDFLAKTIELALNEPIGYLQYY